MNRGQVGQRIGQRQLFGAVLRFSEFHEAFGQRLGLGVFFASYWARNSLYTAMRSVSLTASAASGKTRAIAGRRASATRIFCEQP